jgi:hypothetical protein
MGDILPYFICEVWARNGLVHIFVIILEIFYEVFVLSGVINLVYFLPVVAFQTNGGGYAPECSYLWG